MKKGVSIFGQSVLLPVFFGIIGGAGIAFAILRIAAVNFSPAVQNVAFVRRTSPSTAPGPFNYSEVAQSLVFLSLVVDGKDYIALRPSRRIAVALTSDGLIAAFGKVERAARLLGVAPRQSAVEFEAALDADRRSFFEEGSGLSFLRVSDGAGGGADALWLKPVVMRSYEDLAVGEALAAIHPDGATSFHRLTALGNFSGSDVPASSEYIDSTIYADGELPAGAFVFNMEGEVVGLASDTEGRIFPAEEIGRTVRLYLQERRFAKTFLGVQFVDLNFVAPLDADLPSSGILLVKGASRPAVLKNSPAALAGLQEGDVLTSFDGRPLDGSIPFSLLLQRYPSGAEVEVVFLRAGQEEKTRVKLGELP